MVKSESRDSRQNIRNVIHVIQRCCSNSHHAESTKGMTDDMLNSACAGPLILKMSILSQDDVINWKHFSRYWPFLRGIHRWPVNSPHKGQWRRALIFSLICSWTNNWANNGDTGDLRHHCAHYDVTVMLMDDMPFIWRLSDVESGRLARRSPINFPITAFSAAI